MGKIEKFAKENKLKITKDECGDQIIRAKQGHLYFDDSLLCYMALDYRGRIEPLQNLGGSFWAGDIFTTPRNSKVRDIKVVGIDPKNWSKALTLFKVRRRKVLSPEHRKKLLAAGQKCRFLSQNQSEEVGR